ncbi:cryptochrome/photolyase family protein [Neochlamydia sp. S13]|uniref:cryptochrome/photolyase family protein n=1 Tax=Neochlamydia sp. S13 TaxID=1353976 RepID=UPI0005A87520|nr:cryptochrome/photolyase family protein [Neochlamydia sp. S13]BBI17484.1 Deoxyribodipyrimidine photolyase-like protein [Neochlamydia sp. S13]
MKEITLIFPHQLFEKHPALDKTRPVCLAEEFLFFKVQKFHKQKLVLLRAAMKAYADWLEKQGYSVFYIDSTSLNKRGDLFEILAQKEYDQVHLANLTDDWLSQDLTEAARKNHWNLCFYESPMFLCTEKELQLFFKGKTHYSMAPFYIYQRKKLNILMEGDSPVGGKYSFDKENRERLPKGIVIPPLIVPKQNRWVKEAVEYVEKEFPNAYGKSTPFSYAVTFSEAKEVLFDFVEHRLQLFGTYEDAIHATEAVIFHSGLSPLLNIGLITPQEVVEKTLSAYTNLNIPLNSLEGFLRQIIGWREFIRACYLLKGRKERCSNFFKHTAPLPKGFWDGTTGILPIDNVIKRLLQTGYCHHIERLMILGNFLLLVETNPNAVYEWFMGYFVDAYDWVMVPNVYGMSQYADKGLMSTKPYISGANYLLKMSAYNKEEWVDKWDGLFWRFLAKHQAFFERNPRTKMLLKLLQKNANTIHPKIALAETWLMQQR